MGFFSGVKSVDLFAKALKGELYKMPGDAYSARPEIEGQTYGALFERVAPEKTGVDSGYIADFFRELRQTEGVNAHAAIVVKDGAVIAETSFYPYKKEIRKHVFSVSKSVTSLAVGFAVDEGLLSPEDTLVSIFPERAPLLRNPRLSALKIKHLLEMSSGVNFNEMGSAVEKDWLKNFLESDFSFEPGAGYNYNSLNTYVLGRAVAQKSGRTLTEFLMPRLFEPLGIENVCWEKCPMGYEKAGWGLYVTVEEAARIAQVFLGRGETLDKNGNAMRFVSRDYIASATSVKKTAAVDELNRGYGWQIWCGAIEDSAVMVGLFGQSVTALPKHNMIVAVFSGCETAFCETGAQNIVVKYFGGELPPAKRFCLPGGLKRAVAECESARSRPKGLFSLKPRRRALEKFKAETSGVEFVCEKSGSAAVLPIIEQFAHGNYSPPVTSVRFDFDAGAAAFKYADGETVCYRSGLREYAFREDKYKVLTSYELRQDEDGNAVYIATMSFLQSPCVRKIKFRFVADELQAEFSETPSIASCSKMVLRLMGANDKRLLSMAEDVAKRERVKKLVDQFGRPVVTFKKAQKKSGRA